jgi:hypothetical protein
LVNDVILYRDRQIGNVRRRKVMHRPGPKRCGLLIILAILAVLVGQTRADPLPGALGFQARRWQLIGPPGGEEVFDIDVDPNDPTRLYATTRAGVYRSTDGGVNWSLSRAGFYRQLVIDPQNGNNVYVCPGVCKSTNGGEGWNCTSDGMTDPNTASLAIAASSPSTLFAGSF